MKDKWISIGDIKPTDGTNCIVTNGSIIRYATYRQFVGFRASGSTLKVTHWFELDSLELPDGNYPDSKPRKGRYYL